MRMPCGRCGRYRPGEPFDIEVDCRWCWLEATDPAYAKLWADDTTPPRVVAGRPVAEWPWAARMIARLRVPSDTGLGDTIHRRLDRFGGDAMARLYKKITGADCGCKHRQAKLNYLFSYPKEPTP